MYVHKKWYPGIGQIYVRRNGTQEQVESMCVEMRPRNKVNETQEQGESMCVEIILDQQCLLTAQCFPGREHWKICNVLFDGKMVADEILSETLIGYVRRKLAFLLADWLR